MALGDSSTSNISLFSREDRHGTFIGKLSTTLPNVDPAKAFELLRNTDRRGEWDSMFLSGEEVLRVDDHTDVSRLVFKGERGDSDLVLLRSWREEADRWVLAFHSVVAGQIAPAVDGVNRGSVGSSGWVVQRVEGGCELTYIVTMSAGFVKQMGATVVDILAGRGKTIAANVENLSKLLGATRRWSVTENDT